MILEVAGVRKYFGEIHAVEDVSLSIAAGEIVGLLGPNGAGKTSTVSMIAGLMAPDAGEVRIDGKPLRGDDDPAKRRLGLVPQEVALYDELTAIENLRFFGALYGLGGAALDTAMNHGLDFVGLRDRANDRVSTYSGGMKRRLNLAAGMLHAPDLLLLDEPTAGVDPQSRNALFDNLTELKSRGKAILYTTHYMEEAERLCDRVVIVDHGRVIAHDTVRGLYGLLPAEIGLRVELADGTDGTWVADLRSVAGVRTVEVKSGVLAVGLDDLARAPGVLEWLGRGGHSWTHVVSERGDLETVFLSLTGRSLRD